MRKLILIFIILAPLIDFTYRIKFVSIGGLELSPNRIIKFMPIFLFIAYHLTTNRGFLWKNSTYLTLYLFLPFLIGLLSFPTNTIDAFIRFLSSIIFLFFAGRLLNERDFLIILKGWFFISFLLITLSYLQFLGYFPYTDFDTIAGVRVGRVSGGYEKQVAMVSYLIYTFSYAIFVLLTSENIIKRFFSAIYLLALLLVIIMTTHRASMVIFSFILFYFLFMYNKKYFPVFLFLLLVIIISYREYIISLYNLAGSIETISRGKIFFWSDYISNLLDSGFLFVLIGKGHSVLDTPEGQFLPFGFDEPHSDYVRIFYQYGVIGLFLYLFLMLTIIKTSITIREKTKIKNIRFLVNLEIIIGVSILLYSLTIEPTRYPSFLWLFMAIASYLLVNKDNLIEKGVA